MFYNRFPAPKTDVDLGTETDINLHQQLWYHVAGTPQERDTKVLELPGNPDWMIGAEVTDDGRCASALCFMRCCCLHVLALCGRQSSTLATVQLSQLSRT